MNTTNPHAEWLTVSRPGYQGKHKDEQTVSWDKEYGRRNWRIAWELNGGLQLTYDQVFHTIYVPGYVSYFRNHPDEALMLSANHAYAFDKDMISRRDAFNHRALYNVPGRPNQFHHVALILHLSIISAFHFKDAILFKFEKGSLAPIRQHGQMVGVGVQVA